jgi:two-component system, OmpR family, response regulator VanR
MDKMLISALKDLNLLYVDDNENIYSSISTIFNSMFNKVFIAENGARALDIINKESIQIIISDIDMPKMNGIEMAKKIREKNNHISIIFLTAHVNNDFLFDASNLQIDGYLTKPINLQNIKTALTNAIKKNNFNTSEIKFSNGSIYNTKQLKLTLNIEEIPLGKKEHSLLKYLIDNPNICIEKEKIEHHIWDYDEISENSLKNLVYHLRKKIGKESIESIAGEGYTLILK